MANEKFLNSNLVSVYPSGYRSATIDLEASRTTEGSVTKALCAVADNKSYAFIDLDNSMTIVLDGYIFKIKPNAIERIKSLFSSTPDKVYAYLITHDYGSQDEVGNSLKMLVNFETTQSDIDSEGKFKGLAFSDTQPTDSNVTWLLLLDGSKIPQISQQKSRVVSAERLFVSSIESLDNESAIYKHLFVNHKGVHFAHCESFNIGYLKDNVSSGTTNSVGVNEYGVLQSQNLAGDFQLPAPSGDDVYIINHVAQTSNGKISAETSKLPLAGSTFAGLVSPNAQNFVGLKGFNDDIKTKKVYFRDPTNTTSEYERNTPTISLTGFTPLDSNYIVELGIGMNSIGKQFTFNRVADKFYFTTPSIRISNPEDDVNAIAPELGYRISHGGGIPDIGKLTLDIEMFNSSLVKYVPFQFDRNGTFYTRGIKLSLASEEEGYPTSTSSWAFALNLKSEPIPGCFALEAIQPGVGTKHTPILINPQLKQISIDSSYELTSPVKSIQVLTTAPTQPNTNGTELVVLTSEPIAYYEGYIYYIVE